MSKTLVAFFSASGTTKRVAEKLVAATGNDSYAIKPTVPYIHADLNWQDKHSRSSVEMNSPSARSERASSCPGANIVGERILNEGPSEEKLKQWAESI